MTQDRFVILALVAAGAFLVTTWLVGRLRVYALRRNLVDEVGERSSHARATPRGGGLAIVILSLPIVASLPFWTSLPPTWAMGLAAAGAIVAAAGWVDDHGHVPAGYRLLLHCAAAIVLLALAGPVPLAWLGLGYPPVEWLLSILMVVWLINLFNFMDGIDGIAASEAITVWTGLAIILLTRGTGSDIAALSLLAAAVVTGFLVWNWAPAKIFMGDVSSGFLGIVSSALVLFCAQLDEGLAAAVLVLLAVFVVDATVTVVRRALRRSPVHEAHRSHAYQILSRTWAGHARVTLVVIAINTVFLLPLAFLAAKGTIGPVAAVMFAYLPLALAALMIGAGAEAR